MKRWGIFEFQPRKNPTYKISKEKWAKELVNNGCSYSYVLNELFDLNVQALMETCWCYDALQRPSCVEVARRLQPSALLCKSHSCSEPERLNRLGMCKLACWNYLYNLVIKEKSKKKEIPSKSLPFHSLHSKKKNNKNQKQTRQFWWEKGFLGRFAILKSNIPAHHIYEYIYKLYTECFCCIWWGLHVFMILFRFWFLLLYK